MLFVRIVKTSTIQKSYAYAGALAFVLILLAIPSVSLASGMVDTILEATLHGLGSILEATATFLGFLTLKIIHVLVGWIAPYNNFVGFDRGFSGEKHPVEIGWTIVRDFSNMFFIVILLVIAFGTMLRAKGYEYRERLPKLIVMAILINFSRTIMAVIIDAAQVFMLTFVNAFQAAAGGNFILGLGIYKVFDIPKNSGAKIDTFAAIGSFIFANIFLAIVLMVMVIITAVLVARIVMLWMITILSPLAFLLSTIPNRGEKYYAKWWDEFICWTIQGPVLAFFLWLALATMVAGGNDIAKRNISTPIGEGPEFTTQPFVNEAAQEQNLVRFFIGIMMLLAGVKISQDVCDGAKGIIGGISGWAKQKATSGVKVAAGAAIGLGVGAALLAPKGAWAGTKAAAGWVDYKTGIRKRAYGGKWSPIRAVAPGFAAGRLANLQAGSTEKYQAALKNAKAAAGSSPLQIGNLADRMRPVHTAEGDAQAAAFLKTALTDPRVYEAELKEFGDAKDEFGNTEADRRVKKRFNRYQEIANTSGNQEVLEGWKEVKKENPHLIQGDDEEIRKTVGKMGGADALKMNADALADPRVFSALSASAIKHVKDRGSEKQRENIEKAERRSGAVTSITDAKGLDAYLKGKDEKEAKTDLTTFLDKLSERLGAEDKKDGGARQQDMLRDVMSRGLIDPNRLTPKQLTANDGALAGQIALHGNEEMLGKITGDKRLKGSMVSGLEDYRASTRKPKDEGGRPPLKPDQNQRISEGMFAAGGDVHAAFRDASFADAVKGPRGRAIIQGLKPGQLKKDVTLRTQIVDNVQIDHLRQLMDDANDQGNAELQKVVKETVRAIIDQANSENYNPEVTRKAEELRDPTYNDLK